MNSPVFRRFLVLAACLVALSATPARAQATSPDGVCNTFMQAIQSRDWKKAYDCFSHSLQKKTPYQRWAMTYEQYAPMFIIEHWKVDVQASGDRAAGKIAVTSKTNDEEHDVDNDVILIKEDGEWRIDSYK